MLAHLEHRNIRSGKFNKNLQPQFDQFDGLLEFIINELPQWRDDKNRPKKTAEDFLTDQLCDYLNSAIYDSNDWDLFQFRTEVPEKKVKNRKIDIALKPRKTIMVEGIRYGVYDTLLPIECKRLPTPKCKDRDEHEYIIHRNGSTGGIQRFKEGHHGANHKLGAMIAYIQDETRDYWCNQIEIWFNELIQEGRSGWSNKDKLHVKDKNNEKRISVFRSQHERVNELKDIELRHLWIEMN